MGGIISEWVGGIIPESWAACSGIRKSSLFTTSDSDGDTVTQYAFWNTGAGGGRFLIGGIAQATSHEIDVLASQLSQVTYQPGSLEESRAGFARRYHRLVAQRVQFSPL